MKNCYYYKKIVFDDPLFKNIPTSILLTMHNSKREKQYLQQIMKFKPTRTVLIQINQGYKNCNKPDWVNSTVSDLWHANITAFEHVNFEGPLLVLEDDVEFTDYIYTYAREIDKFITSKEFDIYSLGSVPKLNELTLNKYHIRMFAGGMAQAVIFSTHGMNIFKDVKINQPHDEYIYGKGKSFLSRKPCAIQSFEMTDNFKFWAGGSSLNLLYFQIFGKQFFHIHHNAICVGGVWILFFMIILLIIIITYQKLFRKYK